MTSTIFFGEQKLNFFQLIQNVRSNPLTYHPSPNIATYEHRYQQNIDHHQHLSQDMSAFKARAKQFTDAITFTNERFLRLTTVVKEHSLFTDSSSEIHRLTTDIKSDLTLLQQTLTNLQQYVTEATSTDMSSLLSSFFQPMGSSSHQDQSILVKQVIINDLRTQLTTLTKSFGDTLQLHAQLIQADTSRKNRYEDEASSSTVMTGVGGASSIKPIAPPSAPHTSIIASSAAANPTGMAATTTSGGTHRLHVPQFSALGGRRGLPPPPQSQPQRHHPSQPSSQPSVTEIQPSLYNSNPHNSSSNNGTHYSSPQTALYTNPSASNPTTAMVAPTHQHQHQHANPDQMRQRNIPTQQRYPHHHQTPYESYGRDNKHQDSEHDFPNFSALVDQTMMKRPLMDSDDSQLTNQNDTYYQSRATEISQIHSTIEDVAMMYGRLNELVHQQEETALRIDSNIDEMALNIDAGHDEILDYYKNTSSNQWLLIKIFIVLIVFALFFITVIS